MTTTAADGGTGVLAGERRMLIDGDLAGASGGVTFDVINPATEEVAGVAADGRPADFDRAVASSREAEALAKASIFQATQERDAWKTLEIR